MWLQMSFGHFDCNVATDQFCPFRLQCSYQWGLQFGYRWLQMSFDHFDCNVVTDEFWPFDCNVVTAGYK